MMAPQMEAGEVGRLPCLVVVVVGYHPCLVVAAEEAERCLSFLREVVEVQVLALLPRRSGKRGH